MLRKTFFTLVSVAALGLGSAAMAARGGGGGGGGGGHGSGGGGHVGGGGWGGGGGGWSGGGRASVAAMPGGSAGPMMIHGGNMDSIRGSPMATAPMTSGRVQGWGGRTAWGRDHFHDHFHHRFRNRNFFAFGFGGPIYDYASCWSWVPSRFGWQWVNVCGDYY
jgi:hypothetical protein